ncbi:MAG: hypothetical protein ABEJ67_05715 [Halanaeroarchaeum sp.]
MDGSPDGDGTDVDPLDTIQAGVKAAAAGETVVVEPGEYFEEVYSYRSGTAEEPITITGPADAVVRPQDGQTDSPLFTFNDSHIHLTGLTLDGLHDPTRPGEVGQYTGPLVETKPTNTDEYLTDITFMPHAVGNSRSAVFQPIRTNHMEIGGFRVIGPAGVQHLIGNEPGHVGEIVYLGTAPGNVLDDWYPWETLDRSHDIHVHHIVNDAGYPHAELVDVKGGVFDVTIEYCTDLGGAGSYVLPDHPEYSEAAIHLGGNETTLRWCRIENAKGHAVEVGNWGAAHPERAADDRTRSLPDGADDTGKRNAIYGNRFVDYGGLAIRYPTTDGEIVSGFGPDAQEVVCGNTISGPTHGIPDRACPADLPRSATIGHLGGDSPFETDHS